MSFERRGALAPDHPTLSYPGSVLRFRGPRGDPAAPHVLCLGGTETFGRFVTTPYPEVLAGRIATPVINMGVAGGGFDVIMSDRAIAEAMCTATAIVLQVPGAHSLSNRLYTVHPRRNDRFVRASGTLRTIFRDVDFTEFHFTRHMLDHLRALSADRFDIVRTELRVAWMARMNRFLSEARVPVHLLWLACRQPADADPADALGDDPLFVTAEMFEEVGRRAASVSVVSAPRPPRLPQTVPRHGMAVAVAAARMLPGPDAHREAAEALARSLSPAP